MKTKHKKALSFGEGRGETKSLPFRGDLEGFAAIFDMDGTLIDNTPYHYKSWQMLYKKYGMCELSKETYYKEISGVPVLETIRRVFGEVWRLR